MKYRIVADSSCDLMDDFFQDDEIDFSTVPLKVIIDGKEFVDDESLDVKTLLNAMRMGKSTSSSCPSPGEFAAEFRKNVATFCISMTSALSGTYNSAVQAMGIVKEENSEAHIEVIDSLMTSSAMILMIFKVREYIKSGFDFDTICAKMKEYQKSLYLRFVLQDLDNLVKSGRMSRVAGVFASALSLCPICAADKGEIVVLEKVRGTKAAISHLANTVMEKINQSGEKEFPVVITHCNNPEQANDLKGLLLERFNLKNVEIYPMRGLASYYANNKGLIMAF